MGMFKRIFNRARLAVGADPLFVTTSVGTGILTYDDGEVKKFPVKMTAEAQGWSNPRQQFWRVKLNTWSASWRGEEAFNNQYRSVTYDKMLEAMKGLELRTSREAGLTGTDAEIVAARRKVAGATNVVNFLTP